MEPLKKYCRKGGHIDTRGSDRVRKNKRNDLATGEGYSQRKFEILKERDEEKGMKPLTQEEFHANRRKEEAEEREKLLAIRRGYEESEKHIRKQEIQRRHAQPNP